MSLFPAYSKDLDENAEKSLQHLQQQIAAFEQECCVNSPGPEPAEEERLLATDSSDEESVPAPRPALPPEYISEDFYYDNKLDRGNLRVSTLYYPGRPEYSYLNQVIGKSTAIATKAEKLRRYYQVPAKESSRSEEEAAELSRRSDRMQRALQGDAHNVDLWLQFIDFQECWFGAGGGAAAAEAGAARNPHDPRLRSALLRLQRENMTYTDYMAFIKNLLSTERVTSRRVELWWCAVEATCLAPAACSLAAVGAVTSAALQDPAVRPDSGRLQILYLYGSFLSSAGLSEQLVLLVELLCAMNYTPLPEDKVADTQDDAQLIEYEDKMMSSGLPLHAVWWRVERARAHAHWRPTNGGEGCDPQRAAAAADVAEYLLPVTDDAALFTLATSMLRWIGVPLIGFGQESSLLRSLHGSGEILAGAARLAAAHAHALLPLLAARGAGAGAGGRLLQALADPPHPYTDQYGYLRWVCVVWQCVTSRMEAAARDAVLAWRLRWYRAMALVAQDDAERKRIRAAARGVIKQHSPPSPLLAAEWARLANVGGASAAGAGLHALRCALTDDDTDVYTTLYIARTIREDAGWCPAAQWAAACAVLGRSLPLDLHAPPSDQLMHIAFEKCEERCLELESSFSSVTDTQSAHEPHKCQPWRALLPSSGEWGAARAALASPHTLLQIYQHLMDNQHWAASGGASARYHEESLRAACERRAGSGAAAAAALHPHNVTLALLCAQRPVWALEGSDMKHIAQLGRSPISALASLLPAALAAVDNDWDLQSCLSLSRCARRVTSRCPAAALPWLLYLQAAARTGGGQAADSVAFNALTHVPSAKWIYAVGAGAGGPRWEHLVDLLVEKQLRLHALQDELAPLPAAAAGTRHTHMDTDAT